MIRKIVSYGIAMLMMASCTSESDKWEPVNDGNTPAEVENEPFEWKLTGYIKLTPEEKSIMDGINGFSHKLIKEVAGRAESEEGFCVSPVSASIYLGMLANATQGDFQNRILEAYGADSIEKLNIICEKMLHYLPYETNGSSISINNRFWVADTYTVPENFES